MGRRKKHNKYNRQGNNGASNSNRVSSENGNNDSLQFTNREKHRIRAYLEDYLRVKSQQVNRGNGLQATTATPSPREAPPGQEIKIAGIVFPPLTGDAVLFRPFLALPSELAFRQRQYVHDCCKKLGLFHCGNGEYGSSERYVAISIYCDVFDCAEGFQPSRYMGFYRSFVPWYNRRENVKSREETTKQFKRKIQDLIDQPGKCIRDDIDTLDFKQLEGADLSKISPPTLENDSQVVSSWVLVDTADKMRECAEELQRENVTELAFDLEAYNPSKFTQNTCLIQLRSNLEKEYVIDPLAEGVWDSIELLSPLFEDPGIVKIGHSISGLDARCLHRDFGIFICNVFDTYEAAQVLQLPSHGLAAVCEYYGLQESAEYSTLKGEYQTTDWRRRPLSEEMLLYGRYDVHYLVKLRKLMMRDLSYAELFQGGDAEAKLVAESLAATLKRIQDFEDGVEYETASEVGSKMLSLTTHDGGSQPATKDSIENEIKRCENDDNFNNPEGKDAFFAPKNSNIFDDSDEGDVADRSTFTDDVDEPNNVKTTMIANAQVLRMQPRLMRVISFSQERCLDLWSSKSEPHYRNATFVSLMQGARKDNRGKQVESKRRGPLTLTEAQIQLYEDLVRLRVRAARRVECLPGFLCSLDDLAFVAWGRPTNIEALRVISHFLPESLRVTFDEFDQPGDLFLEQIFLLTQKSLKSDAIEISPYDATVKRYYIEKGESKHRHERWSFRRKMLVAAVGGGIALVAMAIVRRRRK